MRHVGSQLGQRKPSGRTPRRSSARERALEVAPLLVVGLVDGAEVGVGVVADLVPGLEDLLHGLRVAVGSEAGDEERGRDAVVGEHAEDPRPADVRPVRLVAHRAGVVGVAAALDEHGRLGVDVEGEAGLDHGAPPIPRSASSSKPTFAAASAVCWPGPS